MKKLIFLLVLVLIIPSVAAQSGHIKLLAMIESGDKQSGALADLALDIKPGSERVFLETFPLTKITTQVSLRFAQQIACDEFDVDCSDYDFFYTISALPGIVGGPSAGSAAAVLSAALINGDELRKDVGITGTINSGGLIGPVGGIKQKMDAASKNGIAMVLIPRGTAEFKEDDNTTIDLIKYGEELGIEVKEVATLHEAYEYFTGVKIPQENGELIIEKSYQDTMSEVANKLCTRTKTIAELLEDAKLNHSGNITEYEQTAFNHTQRAIAAFDSEEYYSSASYCFRSNVLLKRAYFSLFNYSDEEIAKSVIKIKGKSLAINKEIENKSITTLNALQTLMAVKERLSETDELLFEVLENLNDTKAAAQNVAYAEERLYSASVWGEFFDTGTTEFILDNDLLHNSCLSKISEAEERHNYVKSFMSEPLENVLKNLQSAYRLSHNQSYVMCLYNAAQAKAQADVILGAIGVKEDRLDELIDLKLGIVKKELISSQKKGVFPIIGYSYYEYAKSLADYDKFSSLLFIEYALEFSTLDVYFEEKNSVKLPRVDKKILIAFLIGILLGISMALPRKRDQTLQTPRKKRLRGKKR